MAQFSEREGFTKPAPPLHLTELTEELRNSLWNIIWHAFNQGGLWAEACSLTAEFFRKSPADEVPGNSHHQKEWLKRYFYELPGHRTYDYIEFFVEHLPTIQDIGRIAPRDQDRSDYRMIFNHALERERSGYRFVGDHLAPITNPHELQSIQDAEATTRKYCLAGAAEHLNTAASLLGKRPEPDYRNSIKESISAVESIARLLGNENSDGLAEALRVLATRVEIHGALRSGFEKLYGYSSGSEGIRHAILEQPRVGFDEAKFMLVACSAFVNFLVSKAATVGLLSDKNG